MQLSTSTWSIHFCHNRNIQNCIIYTARNLFYNQTMWKNWLQALHDDTSTTSNQSTYSASIEVCTKEILWSRFATYTPNPSHRKNQIDVISCEPKYAIQLDVNVSIRITCFGYGNHYPVTFSVIWKKNIFLKRSWLLDVWKFAERYDIRIVMQ